ncbi:cytochrome P450 monooxygenase pc-bph [Clavulina sp. PMI_390]|nr:cytochrome P450 monooxygenase pc-bph [Clavulina sp. PMI_390]
MFLSFPPTWIWGPGDGQPIPGPWLAKFSDFWLARSAQMGNRSGDVHELHRKYGKVVRIAPNHISIAEPEALQVVYASEFYDAFVSIHRGLFNTRDRAEHTRKRKIVSNIFSQQNVLQFEPYVRSAIALLLKRIDDMYVTVAEKGLSASSLPPVTAGTGPSGAKYVYFDALNWYNFLAFDIIGDLAFGSPFGMLKAGKDIAPVMKTSADGKTTWTEYLPAVEILNYRGTYSASLGVIPVWARPWIKAYVPWYSKGNEAVKNLAGIAVAAVEKRLAEPSDRNDLLSFLQKGKDASGNPMGRNELTAEALTQLIAGSDTTSNSSCAISYYLAKTPAAQKKLQAELDEALGPFIISSPSATLPESDATHYETGVADSDAVKSLPYLEACINEGLRLHSTSSIGLPRIVPPGSGGLMVNGRLYPEGSILSVPSFTIHRDPDVWGPDVEVFRPERWLTPEQTPNGTIRNKEERERMNATFNPFSYGPRACVGKNLANMELGMILASVFRRFEMVLEEDGQKLETLEGFLRKPVSCVMGVRPRDV